MADTDNRFLFIGGVGAPKEYGGELSKNKLIISRLRELGCDVRVVDTYGARRRPYRLLPLVPALMADRQAPIIISTSFGNIKVISRWIRRFYPRRRMILWVIGGSLAEQVEKGEYTTADLAVFDLLIVESRRMLQPLENSGCANVIHMPNFKDLTYSPDCRSKHIGDEDTLRCVFFSRIDTPKGVDIILEAARRRSLSDNRVAIDFYGDINPVIKERFMAAVDSDPALRYCGKLDFFDPSGLATLSQYHISLFPTFWEGEGFPGVIVDSYAASMPVLASDWRFNCEYVGADTGFICRAQDADDFARIFWQLADNRVTLNDYFGPCRQRADAYDIRRLVTDDFINRFLK